MMSNDESLFEIKSFPLVLYNNILICSYMAIKWLVVFGNICLCIVSLLFQCHLLHMMYCVISHCLLWMTHAARQNKWKKNTRKTTLLTQHLSSTVCSFPGVCRSREKLQTICRRKVQCSMWIKSHTCTRQKPWRQSERGDMSIESRSCPVSDPRGAHVWRMQHMEAVEWKAYRAPEQRWHIEYNSVCTTVKWE